MRSNDEFWANGTIPWLKTEQLGEKYIFDTNEHITEKALQEANVKIFPENTLSIAMYGEGKTRGNVSILKRPMATNQACCNIELDAEKVSSEYVYYFLKTQYENLRGLSSGIRKNLNTNDIKNFVVRLPENLKTQQSIAAVLSALDKKIALNKQINARLEEMAKTLYDYWFVQFDFPDANGKPYKSSGGEMVFDETLKREIPKGWVVKSLGEIADLYQPATLSEKELNKNGQFLVYGANGIIGKYNKFNHENPVVAVACRGNSCGAINITQPKSWITGNAMVVNPKNKNMCIDFIKNTLLVNNLDKVVSGSAQPQITRTNFAPLKVILPSEALLKLYSDIVNSMFNKRINQIQQNAKLTQLRDFLLPMLMNGQVSVMK